MFTNILNRLVNCEAAMEANKKDPVHTTDAGTQAPAPVKGRYVLERAASPYYVGGGPNEHKKDSGRTKRLDEALDVLMGWPSFDIWPFKIACPVLALSAAIPGSILNAAFRNAFVLGHIGRVSSYLSAAGLPALVAGTTHFAFVTSDILQQNTACSVCVQVRAVALQVGVGVFYPLFLAPVVNLWFGSRMNNLYLPKVSKQPKAVLSLVLDEFKKEKVKNRLLLASVAQIILAMGVTYLEQDSFHTTLLPIINGEVVLSKEKRYKSPIDRGY